MNTVSLSNYFHPCPLTYAHIHTSQASAAGQEADSDWPKGFHPAQTTDYSCAIGSSSSSHAGQDNHHPAPADHCAPCGKTSSSQHQTGTPCRSGLTLQHIKTCFSLHCIASDQCISHINWKFDMSYS